MRETWTLTGAMVAVATVLCIPSQVLAQTYLYNYTGNNYSYIHDEPELPGSYNTSQRVTVTLELSGALAPDLVTVDISSMIVSYVVDDGRKVLTENDSFFQDPVNVSTDSNGNIIEWFIAAHSSNHHFPGLANRIVSQKGHMGLPEYFPIVGETGEAGDLTIPIGYPPWWTPVSDWGETADDPGTWVLVPEPSTFVSLALGSAVIAIMAKRKRMTNGIAAAEGVPTTSRQTF